MNYELRITNFKAMIMSLIKLKRRERKSRRDGSNIGVMLNLIQHPFFQGIAGQARNDGADRVTKTRRDDSLLTDGFNRRMSGNVRPLQSPEGTALYRTAQVSSLRDFGAVRIVPLVRRLKSTVNKGSSLQDFAASHNAVTRGHAPLSKVVAYNVAVAKGHAPLSKAAAYNVAVTRRHAPLLKAAAFCVVCMLFMSVVGAQTSTPEWTQSAYRQQHYPAQEWYVGYAFARLTAGGNAAKELDALKSNALNRLAESIIVTINSETSLARKSLQRGEIDEISTDYSQAIRTATSTTTVRTEVQSYHNTATGDLYALATVRRADLAAFYRRQLNVDLNKAEIAVGVSEQLAAAGKKMSARQKVVEARKALVDVYSYIDLLAAVSAGADQSDMQIERTGDLMKTVERMLIQLEQSTFVYMNCSYEKRSAKDDAFGSDPRILCDIIAQALTENECSITDSREEADYELTLITSTTQRSDGKTGQFPILSYYANARGNLYNRATQKRTVEFTILNNPDCYEAGNTPEDAATAAFNLPELRDMVLEKILPKIKD